MVQIDAQEEKIIRELIRNPRISDNKISRRTGVPVMSVNRKRKSLEKRGLISYYCDFAHGGQGTQDFFVRQLYIVKFKGGVTREQFLKDPQLQEDWARHYYLREITPQASHYWSRHQKTLKAAGVRNLEEVKALIHFIRASGVKQLATTGKYEVPGQNLTIPQYLGKFRTALASRRKSTPKPGITTVKVGRTLSEIPTGNLKGMLKEYPNAIILD